AEYMKWVRECLWVLTGDNNVRTGNGHDKYVQDAISRYQGGKKKANLTVDGWVGVQTEIVLALETGIMPPARYGKPPDFPKPKNLDQHIKTWLDHTEIDLLEGTLPAKLPFKLAHHVDDRKYFALFVKRLIHGGYNYDYLDWSTVKDYCDLRDATARPEQLQHVNAMRHLRYLVTTKVNPLADNAYPLFLWACFEVFEDVEHGLWRVAYEYGRHSLDVEKGRTKLLMDYTEGRVANPSSFLSIYPGWREWKGKPTWEAAK
ncbi:MAG: hypothetical protein ABIU07_02420, partial [Ramlibacter sp.]